MIRPMKKTMSGLFVKTFFLVGLAVAFNVIEDSKLISQSFGIHHMWVEWGLTLAWFVIGAVLVHRLAATVRNLISTRHFFKMAVLVNGLFSGAGYVFVFVVSLHLLHIKIGSILVGGALTGVIVGIAAQSTLSNLFAGSILFTLRPITVGQTIIVRSYLFGGIEYSGVVADINWYHTILLERGQKRVIPNSSIIVSAITIITDETAGIYLVPIPYSASVHEIESALQQVARGPVQVTIRDFAESFYRVEIKVPIEFEADVVRRIIHEFSSPRMV